MREKMQMRRRLVALLVGVPLAIGASPSTMALARSAEEGGGAGPVVFGGRIEVPAAGFALEVPEGWYAFDLSAPDLQEALESFDGVTAMLAPLLASVSLESLAPDVAEAYPDATVPLVALSPLDEPGGENCVMVVEPMDTEALEDMVARELQGLRTMSGIDGVVPSYIDLPAGRLAMAEYSAPSTGGLEQSVFFLLHDGRGYSLTCTAASRHADRWLTVAQSIEFLPAE